MKFTILALLILSLIVGLANLVVAFGIIKPPTSEYRAYPAQIMDEIGFRKLADANGIEVGEDGKIKFPPEMRDKILKHNMVPFTISEIEKEGWRFVSVTSDDYYLFRK